MLEYCRFPVDYRWHFNAMFLWDFLKLVQLKRMLISLSISFCITLVVVCFVLPSNACSVRSKEALMPEFSLLAYIDPPLARSPIRTSVFEGSLNWIIYLPYGWLHN